MIEKLSLSISNLGSGILPSYIHSPGWYYSDQDGWYLVDYDCNRWYGNPYTGQIFGPLFIPQFDWDEKIPATTIGGPVDAVNGDDIEIKWKFGWRGNPATITLRAGACILLGLTADPVTPTNIEWSVDVPGNVGDNPVYHDGTEIFPLIWTDWKKTPRHMYIVLHRIDGRTPPSGFNIVYEHAFNITTTDIRNLEIIDHAVIR